jgi:exopolysaccharide biosynthesis protein
MRGEDAFRAAVRGEEGGTESNEIPVEMARRYQAVLAITGDNLTVNEPEYKGIIIRNGRIYNRRQEWTPWR